MVRTSNSEHTDAENATYWANEAEAWFDANVTLSVDDVVAIAGQAVVDLPKSYVKSNATAVRAGLIDAGFPHIRIEARRDGGFRLRIEANDDRLPVSHTGAA